MNIQSKYAIAVAQLLCAFQISLSVNANDIIAIYGDNVLDSRQLSSIARYDHSEDTDASIEQSVLLIIDWLLQIRKKEAIEQYGIEVTTEDLNIILEDTLKGRTEYVRRTNEAIVQLPKALRAAMLNPDKADTIYKKYLEGSMNYGLWQAHLAAQYSEEQIAIMEQRKPIEESELDALIEPLRELTLDNRLREHIERDATVSADSADAWARWCLQQVMEADITIYDADIKKAYEKRIMDYPYLNSQD
jgi:hypothetical protein